MITLTVITLSSFYCISKANKILSQKLSEKLIYVIKRLNSPDKNPQKKSFNKTISRLVLPNKMLTRSDWAWTSMLWNINMQNSDRDRNRHISSSHVSETNICDSFKQSLKPPLDIQSRLSRSDTARGFVPILWQ